MITALFILSLLLILSYFGVFLSRKSYVVNLVLAFIFVLGFAISVVGIVTFAVLI